jgi:hypothetical protein
MRPDGGHSNNKADLHFYFDGQVYAGKAGETLAAALLRAGVYALGTTQDGSAKRGAFCWMGWCQECRVWHEGQLVEACRLIVSDELEVHSCGLGDAG